jgi:hypothetical protein
LEISIKDAIAKEVSENSKKVTPQSSDFKRELEKKVEDKIRDKPVKKPKEKNPAPEKEKDNS